MYSTQNYTTEVAISYHGAIDLVALFYKKIKITNDSPTILFSDMPVILFIVKKQ